MAYEPDTYVPSGIALMGLLAKETWDKKLAARKEAKQPKQNVELLHTFVKSQLKPKRK